MGRGIKLRTARQLSPSDVAADRIALFTWAIISPPWRLSTKPSSVAPANKGYNKWRWFPVRDLPKNTFHAIFQLGTMLHSSGFFLPSTFEYLRHRESILFLIRKKTDMCRIS